ncbi:MAG: POTRA domain-containing protein [Pseudomonadota bacterium]
MIITSAKKKKWQYLLLTSCLLLDSQSVFAERVKMPKAIEPLEIDEKNVLRDLDIPSVRDRNPDPTAGPRLAVTEFRLEGIEEFPELGITREKISQIVEDIRFEIMDEGEVLDSGFTIDELEGLSKLLVTIDDDLGEENIGPIEVQRLIWYVREQMQNRGVTLGMIESVADRITTFYRERGFILAKAYIPEQQVRDGIVTLTLLVGKLGATTVNDNQLYNKNIIMNVFDEMVNQPVTSQII